MVDSLKHYSHISEEHNQSDFCSYEDLQKLTKPLTIEHLIQVLKPSTQEELRRYVNDFWEIEG